MSLGRLVPASGPTNAKIVIVGEAPGKEEDALGLPFVGYSGQELTRMLKIAGISRGDCYITNVFKQRPPDNKVEFFFEKKGPNNSKLVGPIKPGAYLKSEFDSSLATLAAELESVRPNLVIALGATASWALLGLGKISKIRGFIHESTLVPGLKVLPTFHPAAVLRQWEFWTTVVTDLQKACREAEYPDTRLTVREIRICESKDDLAECLVICFRSGWISFDIETKQREIECISFAPSETLAYEIPFFDPRKPDKNYWPTLELELLAWDIVRGILAAPSIQKVGQNGLYDIQYLWRRMGIPVFGYTDDTMLLHHSLYPELQKDLGFLGSIYTNEAAWKHLRRRRTKDEVEKEDE